MSALREEMEELLSLDEYSMESSEVKAKIVLIKKRIDMFEGRIKQLRSSISKYDRNPQKYAPQLRNAGTEANAIRQLGQVIYTLVQSLERAHK